MPDAKILVGDAVDCMRRLPDESVHAIITSPPYFALRKYSDDPLEIGQERTPDEYIERLVAVFREARRVLRTDGSLWVVIGDTYAGDRSYQVPDSKYKDVGNSRGMTASSRRDRVQVPRSDYDVPGCKPKDLIGIPWMLAFALRADGWYLRRDVIWHKTNVKPENVRDRPTSSHEYAFLLSKSSRYFYDDAAIREPVTYKDSGNKGRKLGDEYGRPESHNGASIPWAGETRNKRSVWSIPTEQSKVEGHFAVFPRKLVEPMVLASTSQGGCCSQCGAPLLPDDANPGVWDWSCQHEASVAPCTVLDPFGGSGRTAMVALARGRDAILCEINPEYAQLARDQIENDAPLFNRATVVPFGDGLRDRA